MICPKCKSNHIVKDGYAIKKGDIIQRYRCQNCKKKFQDEIKINKIPNVLLLDIETAPALSMHFRYWKTNINYNQIIEPAYILGYCGKWLFQSEQVSDFVTPEESKNCDDKRIMKSLKTVLDDADIIIGHNIDKFDLPHINTQMLLNGIKPYSPIQTIDTLKVVKRPKTGFKFSHNRLDYLGKLLANKEKLDTDFELWIKCKNGDRESLKYMQEYCMQDVLLLEDVYMQLRGWIKSHPNLNLYAESTGKKCNNCLSEDLRYNGEYYTSVNVFGSYTCNNCGSHMRSRKSKLSKKDKENLFVSNAR